MSLTAFLLIHLSAALARLVHMDEWSAREGVSLAPSIRQETLVVRNVEDEVLEELLPHIFDAKWEEGKWTRDDREATRLWLKNCEEILRDQVRQKSVASLDNWREQWVALANERFLAREMATQNLADHIY